MDFQSLEMLAGGYENILVITDHFTRYAQALPSTTQAAKTTARLLFDNLICHLGFPARLDGDQGCNFESQVIKELCFIANIEKSRTTLYHPMGSGMPERFNKTLLNMLGTLEDHQKSDWKSYVSSLVHAYNSTRHECTGYSPLFSNVWAASTACCRCILRHQSRKVQVKIRLSMQLILESGWTLLTDVQ